MQQQASDEPKRQPTYTECAAHSTNLAAQSLFQLMDNKKTNLAVAADAQTPEQLLDLARRIGPEICLLKTHGDIVHQFDANTAAELLRLATEHQFLIFEDRKIADVPHIATLQAIRGSHWISNWAHFISVHGIAGEGPLKALSECLSKECGILLVAQMSSAGNLITKAYTNKVVRMGKRYPSLVAGFIAQELVSNDAGHIHMTPGVALCRHTSTDGQQYLSPQQVIRDNGSDVIIVGRAIYESQNQLAAAQTFRRLGWNAYLERIGQANPAPSIQFVSATAPTNHSG